MDLDKFPTIPQIVRALITLDDRHDDERARMEERNKVQAAVIKWLSDMLAEILRQANNADQAAVFLEPTEIARLAKVDVPNLLRNELHRLRERRGHEQAQEKPMGAPVSARKEKLECDCGLSWKGEIPDGHGLDDCIWREERPCIQCGRYRSEHEDIVGDHAYNPDEAQNGPQTAAQAVLCTKCGKDGPAHFMWAQGHVPEFPRDLDPRIVEARKGLRQGETHAAVECECGTIWSDGVMGAGHNDMGCTQADPNQAKLDVMRARVEGPLDDVCTCGHKRHQHLRRGAHVGCTACVVRGFCRFFMLAVR